MKKIIAAAAISASVFMTGCAGVATPANGALFSDVQWDSAIANNGVAADKTGEACVKSILGMVATGDASLEAAKKAGGITEVATVAHTSSNILGFVAEYCTVVSGK